MEISIQRWCIIEALQLFQPMWMAQRSHAETDSWTTSTSQPQTLMCMSGPLWGGPIRYGKMMQILESLCNFEVYVCSEVLWAAMIDHIISSKICIWSGVQIHVVIKDFMLLSKGMLRKEETLLWSQNDSWVDLRALHDYLEPTIYTNAAAVGVLAKLTSLHPDQILTKRLWRVSVIQISLTEKCRSRLKEKN